MSDSYDGPTSLICRCGYEPSSRRDLDEHVTAMTTGPMGGDDEDHGETDR